MFALGPLFSLGLPRFSLFSCSPWFSLDVRLLFAVCSLFGLLVVSLSLVCFSVAGWRVAGWWLAGGLLVASLLWLYDRGRDP